MIFSDTRSFDYTFLNYYVSVINEIQILAKKKAYIFKYQRHFPVLTL